MKKVWKSFFCRFRFTQSNFCCFSWFKEFSLIQKAFIDSKSFHWLKDAFFVSKKLLLVHEIYVKKFFKRKLFSSFFKINSALYKKNCKIIFHSFEINKNWIFQDFKNVFKFNECFVKKLFLDPSKINDSSFFFWKRIMTFISVCPERIKRKVNSFFSSFRRYIEIIFM